MIFLSQICSYGWIICSLIYQLEAVSAMAPVWVRLFIVPFSFEQLSTVGRQVDAANTLFGMLMLIYLPCHFGHEIVAKSARLPIAIYESNWLQMNAKQQKTLIIFTERFKRPSSVTIAQLFVLDLQTFKSVSLPA